MSKKPSGNSAKTATKSTEKARREGVAAAQRRIDLIDAGLVRPPETVNGDAGVMPGAQQVASIDVDPKVEIAAAKRHAAKGGKGKAAKAPKPAKPAKAVKDKKAKPDKAKRLSALDAAAQVIAKADGPMTSQALIDAMAAKGLWKSPGGATPSATLYAAMLREIAAKGKASRFKKVDRGLFVSNA